MLTFYETVLYVYATYYSTMSIALHYILVNTRTHSYNLQARGENQSNLHNLVVKYLLLLIAFNFAHSSPKCAITSTEDVV